MERQDVPIQQVSQETPPIFYAREKGQPSVSGEIKTAGDITQREKAAKNMQEKDYTAVDIALRKMLIEKTGVGGLSESEARALIQNMQEKAGEFAFHDGVFLDEMRAAGQPLVDTKRSINITTATGKEAVLKIMLKTDTGEFKLQGDVLDPKGQYAEKLLN